MLQAIQRLLQWVQGSTLKLFFFAGGILLVWGTVAPVGTLVWWINQSTESLGLKKDQAKPLPSQESNARQPPKNINCYVIFLPGVGDFSSDQLTPGEEMFLKRLIQQHPNCVAVSDVFPYSVANKDLGGERLLTPLWTLAAHADGWFKEANILIKIRNLWRFAISSDDRYGPIYNQGIADAMIDRMNAAHPIPTAHPRSLNVILMGTSGGVQVALGAAPYLKQWLNDPRLTVISTGGAFDGEKGFDAVDQMYHLQGKRDSVEDVSALIFPARWSWMLNSPFNRARQRGNYQAVSSGSHAHDGDQGYFGLDIAKPPKTTYVELTLRQVSQLPIWSLPQKQ